MIDPLATLEPVTQARARDALAQCAAAGVLLRVTDGRRPWDRQAKLYASGRTLPGPILTYATPDRDPHVRGAAFDFCFAGETPYPPLSDPRWSQVGETLEAFDLAWGGRWEHPDWDHAERPDWRVLPPPTPGAA